MASPMTTISTMAPVRFFRGASTMIGSIPSSPLKPSPPNPSPVNPEPSSVPPVSPVVWLESPSCPEL